MIKIGFMVSFEKKKEHFFGDNIAVDAAFSKLNGSIEVDSLH